jgi:hypothetical protein
MRTADIIYECEHYSICTYPLYVGKCQKACLDKRDKMLSGTVGAKWKNWAVHKDFHWAECSNCGFRVESHKAVRLDASGTEYTEVIYKFCPMCGKPMEV